MNTYTEKISLWDRMMMAATFAEANERKTALQILDNNNQENRPEVHSKRPTARPEIRV